MIKIPIQTVPNQELLFQSGDDRYLIEIRTSSNSTIISISKNDIAVILGLIVSPYVPLLPYSSGNNFVLNTQNGELPDFSKFNTTQELFFLEEGVDI